MKILIADAGMPFDFQTPYTQPLGGSETSALLLSKGLQELGHSVVILSTIQTSAQQDENRILDNINNFEPYAEQADVIILNRFLPLNINDLIQRKRVFYYTHDAYDQRNVQWLIQENVEYLFEKIFCVSEWQKNTFVKYFNCDPDKFEVIGNLIDYTLYFGHTERNENRLIFSSIPYKGLEILPDLFRDICIESGRELELHVFSSFALYGRNQEDETYMDAFRKLDGMKDVFLHKPVSMRELAYEFMKSGLLIHPHTYHESFSRVFTEGLASGCIPVTVNKGASKEVIGNYGYITEEPNINNIECYEKFVGNVCEALDRDLYGLRIKGKEEMKKWHYIRIARKVESYLNI